MLGTIGLVVVPRKFDVLKTNIFALEASLLWQILVLRTSNFLSTDSSSTATLYCVSLKMSHILIRCFAFCTPCLNNSTSNSLSKLKWIPFYKENKISCCSLIFKLIQGTLPNYLIKHVTVNNQVQSENTRDAKLNLVCLKYVCETEGGKSFLVRACKLWNMLT